MTYTAPVDDMRFVLDALCDMGDLASLPKFSEATGDLVGQILGEAGNLAAGVLAPLNRVGDEQGSVLENGVVRTPDGFRDAYRTFKEGGWNALAQDPAFGGMGLPNSLAFAVQEMWQSANMGFALNPLLTQGLAQALAIHGSDAQKRDYLPKLISGEWTGAMNLTESQAGSDVGALRTKAVRDGDQYRITGQKIFISYGDHDLTENIVHLVLARTPDAAPGSRGISLFLVPKYPVLADGSLGPANDLRAVSLEEKLGIHASPTCIMSFGDNEGALATLVGEEQGGMACMFTLMNIARLGVGIQGLAIGERAYQQARDFARTRVQSRAAGSKDPASIIKHPDVRRMLMEMRTQVEAMRALAYRTIAEWDFAVAAGDEAARTQHQDRLALLTPVVKAWCTDLGFDVASLGVQIHGGAGYIEETGAAQHLRDARITSIYEGTNGIQALDLIGRKVLRDKGAALRALIAEMRAEPGHSDFYDLHGQLGQAIEELDATLSWILDRGEDEQTLILATAVPFLHLTGTVVAGWLMLKAAVAMAAAVNETGSESGTDFAAAKIATSRFYLANILPRYRALAAQVTGGGETIMAMDDRLF